MCRVPSRASLLEGIDPSECTEAELEGACLLENLPGDILLEKVLPLLSLTARVSLASTSTHWHDTLFSATHLWRSLDFASCLNARVDDAAVLRVLRLARGELLCLDVTGCDVLPSTLVTVAQNSPHLEVLRGSCSMMWTKAQIFQVRSLGLLVQGRECRGARVGFVWF